MRGLLGLSCAAILAAAIFAVPKPASALPAASTIAQGHAHAGVVEEVGRRWYRGRAPGAILGLTATSVMATGRIMAGPITGAGVIPTGAVRASASGGELALDGLINRQVGTPCVPTCISLS